MEKTKRLVVVGAGPKAAAIAAKVKAMESCGYGVPEVIIVEQDRIAANWQGYGGYTSGSHQLGTSPEKDVGFPYESVHGVAVTDFMRSVFSWHAFLNDQYAGAFSFAEWIDRGRPQPEHHRWADYLRWVIDKSAVVIISGRVETIVAGPQRRWILNVRHTNGTESRIDADGLVLTGPGSPVRVAAQPSDPRIFDGRSFWLNLDAFDRLKVVGDDLPVCVVGSGETAAAVVVELISRFKSRNPTPIFIVNQHGMIFSRGESYFENQIFSDPERWHMITPRDRRAIINRTDRGVFSQASLATINHARNVLLATGKVTSIELRDAGLNPDTSLWVVGSYDGFELSIEASAVIVAIGFDPWSFVDMLSSPHHEALSGQETRDRIVEELQWDLTIPDRIVAAPLHVPMLAGLAQGPGFPNLSSLGSMADRILARYCA